MRRIPGRRVESRSGEFHLMMRRVIVCDVYHAGAHLHTTGDVTNRRLLSPPPPPLSLNFNFNSIRIK